MKKIFGGQTSASAESIFRQVAQELGVKFDTLKVGLDHVHMLVMIPPSMSVSQALQGMNLARYEKSVSSSVVKTVS